MAVIESLYRELFLNQVLAFIKKKLANNSEAIIRKKEIEGSAKEGNRKSQKRKKVQCPLYNK